MLCQNFNFDGFSGTQIWSPQENDHNSRNIDPTNFFRLRVDPQLPPRQLCCWRVGKQNTVHSCFRQKTRWAPVCVAGFWRVWLLRSAGLDFLKSWDYSLCKCGHFKKKKDGGLRPSPWATTLRVERGRRFGARTVLYTVHTVLGVAQRSFVTSPTPS